MAGEGIRGRRIVVGALLTLSILGACGTGDQPIARETTDSAVVSTGSATGDAAALPASDAADSTVGTTAVPPKQLEDRVLPGTEFDLFATGAVLTVAGVPVDDVLNVRVGPGPEFQVITTLAPTSSGDAVATGRNRDVESGIWAEIEMGDIVGWAKTEFLMQAGAVIDDTANLFPTAQDHPSGPTPEVLARQVADAYASLEPDSTVTIIDGPRHGDLSTVTVDVLGLGDDSIGGYRVHIVLEQVQTGYRVRNVETTTLCARGFDGRRCA